MTNEEFAKIATDTAEVMYRVSKSILKRDEDCEDAVHEAIVKAFSKLYSLKNDSFAKTWLIRIVINECYAILRKRKREIYSEEISEEEAVKLYFSELFTALNRLPADYRVTIVLYYIQGYSVSETADILKVSEGTVKSRLSRGRKKLRNFLEEDF